MPKHTGGVKLSVTTPAGMLALQPHNGDPAAPPRFSAEPFAGDFKGKTKPDSVHAREDTEHATFPFGEGVTDLGTANIHHQRRLIYNKYA